MAAVAHWDASRVPGITVVESFPSLSGRKETMEWHGMYQDLLFQRGAVNPPCSHIKDAISADILAVEWKDSVGSRETEATCRSTVASGQNIHSSTAAVAFVQDFLDNSSKVRERGCSNIPQIFQALGNAVYEFILFLQEFEEGEDDECVLMALCNGLKRFFEGLRERDKECEERSSQWDAKWFSAIYSLVLRIMIHRDRELKMAALGAFSALLSSCDHVPVIRKRLISHVLELSVDQRDTFRQAAASLLPTTLLCAHRGAAALLNGREVAQRKHCPEDLLDMKKQLLGSYVRLCGDKNCTVQLAAGQQLPVFVDYIAAEMEVLQEEHALGQKPLNDDVDGCAVTSDGKIGELMIAVYTATQKFTLSPNESCRIQGVAAVAAMARRNAMTFKALGANFFPMLCSDSSWRVRASACLALEDLAFLFSDSATLNGVQGAESRTSAAAAASCMPSLLFKFLTDRSPMVKIAALQLLRRTAELLGSASFVRDSWLTELHRIGEDERANLGSRLPGACLDAVIGIIPLSNGSQRRRLVELAMELAQRGSWKAKITFLAALGYLVPDELALVSSMILSETFAWDEDGDDCWRIHAAVAQQLPVLLDAELEKVEDWWQRCCSLLLHPAWAVRQEAGVSLRSILVRASRRLHSRYPVDRKMEQRLLRLLQEVASCKNAFIRQELAFYLHQILDFVPSARVKSLALPFLQLLLEDPAPCCRLSLAKLLFRLCMMELTVDLDFRDELMSMLDKLSADEATGVREEASTYVKKIALQLETQAAH